MWWLLGDCGLLLVLLGGWYGLVCFGYLAFELAGGCGLVCLLFSWC